MNNPVITRKTCTKCGETLPIQYFYADKTRSDGYRNVCKECNSTYVTHRPGYVEPGYIAKEELTGRTKRCPSCGEVKDHAYFSKDKSKTDGRRSNCKDCRKGTWRRYVASKAAQADQDGAVA